MIIFIIKENVVVVIGMKCLFVKKFKYDGNLMLKYLL